MTSTTVSDDTLSKPNSVVIKAIRSHHEQIAQQLLERTTAVRDAARRDAEGSVSSERDELCRWYESVLAPHITAEEQALYSEGSALSEARLLVRSMLEEHQVLNAAVSELSGATTALHAAELAAVVQSLFDVHLTKENDLLVPALDQASVPLAEVLDGMHEVLGERAAQETGQAEGSHDGECGCHEHHDTAQATLLDVRSLPHVQRHQVIFSQLNALEEGESLVLVNDHDPKPVRYQIDTLWPGAYEWTYIESGPDRWGVQITRA